MINKNIILASKSPRRKTILEALNIPFKTAVSDAPEDHPENMNPQEIVVANAMIKAYTVKSGFTQSFIIGADTIVYFDGDTLTKPENYDQAKNYLLRLSGNTHSVYTGIALIDSDTGVTKTGFAVTQVTFRRLTRKQLDMYINLVNPYDKAGGYAIQGFGALIVDKIDGCYFNVMGLPVNLLDNLFGEFGISLFDCVEI